MISVERVGGYPVWLFLGDFLSEKLCNEISKLVAGHHRIKLRVLGILRGTAGAEWMCVKNYSHSIC